ncbi:hypothetical protein CapIbe_001282 [Capra ibex]
MEPGRGASTLTYLTPESPSSRTLRMEIEERRPSLSREGGSPCFRMSNCTSGFSRHRGERETHGTASRPGSSRLLLQTTPPTPTPGAALLRGRRLGVAGPFPNPLCADPRHALGFPAL